MRKKSCPLEKEVMDCLKAGKLNPEIEKHTSECPVCEDVVAVYEWMNQFKNSSWEAEMLEKTLPDAETIWNRAQAKQKPDRRLVKKALRPLIYPRVFSYGALIAGVIYLFLTKGKAIGNIISSSSGASPVFDSLSRTIAQLFPIFIIPAAMIIISMLFCVFIIGLEKLKLGSDQAN
jgi:hypothetical protein